MLKKNCLLLLTWLSLLLILLPACGKENEKTFSPMPTPTVTAGPTLTATASPTLTSITTPTPTGPIKIGAIGPWSGPMGMSGMLADQVIDMVKMQLKNMGGILGGREVRFYRGDDRGMVAESSAQAKKLILDDKVTILTLGGVSAAHFAAVAEVAEELKVPYVAFAALLGVGAMKYSVCLYDSEDVDSRIANFTIDYLKSKTVAILGYDSEDSRRLLDGEEGVIGVRDRLKSHGLDIVYEQFFPQDTMDFSPYLTKIKYLNTDVVVIRTNSDGQAITINKQIQELGGWGSIKYYGGTETSANPNAAKLPSALGTYTCALWLPGSDDPGMKAFEDAWMQNHNQLPNPSLTYYYNIFWTAIKAVQLAGTDDPEKVAQALRSGGLEWDSAWGHLRILPDGSGEIRLTVAQIQEGGKLVKVWPQ